MLPTGELWLRLIVVCIYLIVCLVHLKGSEGDLSVQWSTPLWGLLHSVAQADLLRVAR